MGNKGDLMKAICCKFGWHDWIYEDGFPLCRQCRDCSKNQYFKISFTDNHKNHWVKGKPTYKGEMGANTNPSK